MALITLHALERGKDETYVLIQRDSQFVGTSRDVVTTDRTRKRFVFEFPFD